MCMSSQETEKTINMISQNAIKEGNSEFSQKEWQILCDSYISHTPSYECARILDTEIMDVERVYQMFSIRAALSGMEAYLKTGAESA